MPIYLIYGLTDPRHFRLGELRYIGKSSSGLKRPKAHLWPSSCRKKTHLGSWLSTLREVGLLPVIETIQICNSEGELNAAEVSWIAFSRGIGINLTNHTDGGEGKTGLKHSDATKEKMASKKRGKKASLETRAKQAAKFVSKETRERMAQAKRGTRLSDITKKKVSEAGKGRKHTEDAKSRIRKAVKLRWSKIKETQTGMTGFD